MGLLPKGLSYLASLGLRDTVSVMVSYKAEEELRDKVDSSPLVEKFRQVVQVVSGTSEPIPILADVLLLSIRWLLYEQYALDPVFRAYVDGASSILQGKGWSDEESVELVIQFCTRWLLDKLWPQELP